LALVQDLDPGNTVWFNSSSNYVVGDTEAAPGDGVWEPEDYKRYEALNDYWTNMALGYGAAAAGSGAAALFTAPTGVGGAFFAGMGASFSVQTAVASVLAEYYERKKREEQEDCEDSGACSDTAPGT